VAQVYPELVVRSETGAEMSVKYEELIPMQLNEVQRQRAQDAALEARLARLEAAVGATTMASR
jgi:hypothetical protein